MADQESNSHNDGTTFRCAECHNRTGLEVAQIKGGLWFCSRCGSGHENQADK